MGLIFFSLHLVFSLRQYYLVQVRRVDRRYCPLSRVVSQLPKN